MPENNNQQNKNSLSLGWLVIAIDLIALLALAGGIWYGLHAQERYRELLLEKNVANLEASQETDWQAMLAETVTARQALHDSLISADALPEFIDQLETLATSTGTELTLNSVTPADKTSKLKIALTAKGSFSQLWHYAALLEQLPTQFTFTQVTLSRQGVEENKKAPEWQLQASLDL
ncbi:MAG: hypothetical protein AAB364_03155 [Patescibacteria group bacterium]